MVDDFKVRKAAEEDVPLLAEMNARLIEDEGSLNPMSVPQLEARMAEWLESDWRVVIFEFDDEVIGYGIFRIQPDEHEPGTHVAHLRQFFIERDSRDKGFGRAYLVALIDNWFPRPCRVELDVLATNPGAKTFWRRCGFDDYSTRMVLKR
jgi:ribosomal protein S18 acetylase RimI-like enzyme